MIIEAALDACISFDAEQYQASLINFGKVTSFCKDYEKSQIFYALRGITLYNDQGYYRNQELLMNKLQDNKYRRLIYQESIEYKGKLDQFELNPS